MMDGNARIDSDDAPGINTENYYLLLAEWLFIILPFVIAAIILTYNMQTHDFFATEEWAMAALIMFGQSLVKLLSGASAHADHLNWRRTALVGSLIVVIGVVPAGVFLTLILVSPDEVAWLTVVQIVWFIAGVITFFGVGAVSHTLLDSSTR